MKQIFKTLLTLVCGAALFVGCEPDVFEPSLATQVTANVSEVTFEAQHASAARISVTANGDWISVAPDWVTLNPAVGSGSAEVSVTVADNVADGALQGPRSGKITFLGADPAMAVVNVQQEGDNSLDQRRTYVKVDNVKSGKAYLLVVKKPDGSYNIPTLFGPGGTYGYPKPMVAELQDDGSFQFEDNSNGLIFTAVDGGYTIQQPDGRYIWHQSGYNTWSVAAAPTEGNVWKVEPQSDGTVKITDIQNGGILQYGNSGFDSYAAYSSMDGTAVLPWLYEDTKEAAVPDMLVADPAELTVTAEATQAEFTVTSTVDWTATCTSGSDWIKSFSEEGAAGSGKFIAAFDAYTGEDEDRTATFVLSGNGLTSKITLIQQKVVSVVPSTAAAFNALPADDAGTYLITGVVSEVTYSGNPGKYGNFYIEDHTGKVYIYGLLPEKGGKTGQNVLEALGVKDGDVMSVAAPHNVYNGNPQAKNAWALGVYPYKTVAEFNELPDSKDGEQYTLKVEVTKITNTTYGNFEFKDATGTGVTYTCYDFDGTYKAFANLGLEEGNTITFYALKNTYNGTIQAKNCYPVLIEKGGDTPPEPASSSYVPVSEVTEAAAATQAFVIAAKEGDVWHVAKALAENKTYGYLPYVDVTANADGSLPITDEALLWTLSPAPNCWYIQDSYGRYLYMTGTFNSFNVSADLPASGAEWTVETRSDGTMKIICDETGKYIQYDAQYGSWGSYPDDRAIFPGMFVGAREISGGDTPGPGPEPDPGTPSGNGTETSPYNVAAAINAVKNLTWTSNSVYDKTEKVYVKGKISRIANKGTYGESGTYGNASYYISADGTEGSAEFYIFRSLYYNGEKYTAGTDIKKGDEVVVYGALMNYKGETPETVAGENWLYSLNGVTADGGDTPDPGPGPEPEPDDPGATVVSVNWPEALGNPTAHIDPLETYTIDGVQFAFSKGTATTNPRFWKTATANEVRLYNGNTITVTAPAGNYLTKIQFTGVMSNFTPPVSDVGMVSGSTWMGKASTVVLTFTGRGDHTDLKVSYVDAAEADANAQVLINEIWPARQQIEIYNPATADVDIAGYTLSNGGDAWTVPAGRGKIEAGHFLVITCGNSNGPSWKISGTDGFDLVLKDASGKQVDRVNNTGASLLTFDMTYGARESYGRVYDGAPAWTIFSQHSMATTNENGTPEIRGIANVIAALPLSNADIYLTNALVTYAADGYAYLEDATGAIRIKKANHGLVQGTRFNGTARFTGVSGTAGTTSAPVPELTALATPWDVDENIAADPVEMTLAAVSGNIEKALSRKILVKDATVTKTAKKGSAGTLTQGDVSLTLETFGDEIFAEGTVGDFVVFPSYNNKKPAVTIWSNADVTTTKIGTAITTSLSKISVSVGGSANPGATTNSTATIQYYTDNLAIADVDRQGNVTGLAEGECNLVIFTDADDDYLPAEISIPVIVGPAPAAVISAADVALAVGDTLTIAATTTSSATLSFVSADPSIATVTTAGFVTAVAVGSTTITISDPGDAFHKPASKDITVTVTAGAPPAPTATVADIKSAYNGSSATDFSLGMAGALVTYVSGSNFYLEDSSGAILGYSSGHGLSVGDMISGTLAGKVTKYQGNYEITNLDKTSASISSGNTVTPTEVSISTLASNFASYESRYVQVSGVTVSGVSGKNISIAEDASIVLYSNQSGTLPDVGTVINVRGLVTYYNTTKEIKFYSISSDLDVVSTGGGPAGPAAVTFSQPTGAAATAGCSFTVSAGGSAISSGATVASGTTVTLTATAGTGYGFTSWTVTGATVVSATASSTTFTMGTSPVTISATFTVSGGGGSTVADVSIATYASSNSWTNGTKYSSLSIDSNVTATVSGGGNSGKYYTSGNQWRLYQSENASITISAGTKTITSVTITYSATNGGTLKNGTATVSSGAAQSPNASSVTYSVGNTGAATNGQVRITAISVTYQ
ncbi:MAG: lamin tail domain-containing protein [Bacteroidales bacterium]|nr:lamin tail domain-containing protein [Bacteroidales bacterium]